MKLKILPQCRGGGTEPKGKSIHEHGQQCGDCSGGGGGGYKGTVRELKGNTIPFRD